MQKRIISIVTIFLISILLSIFLYNVQAVGIDEIPTEEMQPKSDAAFADIGNIVVGIVRAVGTSIALLMLTIMGIKYIMGSVEEKASYKQSMIPYLIGAILIFSGAQVTQIIYDAVNKVG